LAQIGLGIHLVNPKWYLGMHEMTDSSDIHDSELASLQQGAQAQRLADDLVRSQRRFGWSEQVLGVF
jgi:hypothetical protein